jgi:hypothetical protein
MVSISYLLLMSEKDKYMNKLYQSIAALAVCAGCASAPQPIKAEPPRAGFPLLTDADKAELGSARAVNDERECRSAKGGFLNSLAHPYAGCALSEDDIGRVESLCGSQDPDGTEYVRSEFARVQAECHSAVPPYVRVCAEAMADIMLQGQPAARKCDEQKVRRLIGAVGEGCHTMNEAQRAIFADTLAGISDGLKKCGQ